MFSSSHWLSPPRTPQNSTSLGLFFDNSHDFPSSFILESVFQLVNKNNNMLRMPLRIPLISQARALFPLSLIDPLGEPLNLNDATTINNHDFTRHITVSVGD
jgi:hypothetical protein